MKITFLGSGGCIEKAGSKYVATMVECGDAIYLIDGGCAIADELLRAGSPPSSSEEVSW